MINLYSIIYVLFMIISIISLFISIFLSKSASLNCQLTGYLILVLALMMLLVIIFKNLLVVNTSFFRIMLYSLPFIFMLGIICFILYTILFFKSIIIKGHLSSSYYTYNIITILLMIMQTIYILYAYLTNYQFKTNGTMPKIMTSLFYLFITFVTITSINMYIPLKYFTTDG